MVNAAWDPQFEALKAFKTRERHCNVPRVYPENPSLGMWLNTQRQFKRKGHLSPERIKRLEDLGVVWDVTWERQFAALQAFKASKGHCDLPYHCTEHPSLGTWMNTQRQSKRKGKLSPERIARLEALGVVWDVTWERQFAALQAFKASKGHCDVPYRCPEHPSLGTWMNTQRQSKKTGTLSPERIERLTKLGVAWKLRTQTRS